MRQIYFKIFILTALLGLTGCASMQPTQEVSLARGADFVLLPAAVFHEAVSLTQRVVFEYKGRQHIFLAQLEFDPAGLVMVAMSEFGQTLFSLQYKNDRLVTEMAAFMPRLPELKYLLADLQLIYWPLMCWQLQLQGSAFALVEVPSDDTRHRLLQRNGMTVVDVMYSAAADFSSDVVYRHLERGYTLHATVLRRDLH